MTYSQFGEDIAVAALFPKDFVGIAVDVGATDGRNINNTLLFEERGWRVLCIEANPLYGDRLRVNRAEVEIVACSDYEADDVDFTYFPRNWEAGSALKPAYGTLERWGVIESEAKLVKTNVRTLNTVLAQHDIAHVDYLSVDCEGGELDVLRGFNFARYDPSVLVIESWDEDNPVVPYLGERGYKRVQRLYVNDVFVKEDRELPSL